MKQHPLLIFVALTTTLLCGSLLCTCVTADNPDDKTFGNGRFLRRLRDDVMGRNKQASNKGDAKKDSKKDSKKAAPTPAQRLSQGESTRGDWSSLNGSSAAEIAQAKKALKQNAKKSSIGFGMEIETQKDAMIVTKLNSRGNAAEAGIRKGDVVLSAGGVEVGTLEELYQITNILGNGDQLEFEIARRGQKKKALIQFGEAPKETEVVVSRPRIPTKKVGNSNALPDSARSNTGSYRSVLKDPQANASSSRNGGFNRLPKPTGQTTAGTQLNASNSRVIVEQQQLQIEELQREIARMRQQTGSPSRRQSSYWRSPTPSGPQK